MPPALYPSRRTRVPLSLASPLQEHVYAGSQAPGCDLEISNASPVSYDSSEINPCPGYDQPMYTTGSFFAQTVDRWLSSAAGFPHGTADVTVFHANVDQFTPSSIGPHHPGDLYTDMSWLSFSSPDEPLGNPIRSSQKVRQEDHSLEVLRQPQEDTLPILSIQARGILHLRPTIKRLWIQEDRTLKQVIRILDAEYGIEFSERTFKRRLRELGLRKHRR